MPPGPRPPLAGRIALVTGGGRGIGRAIALGLARDGADVAVNYARDEVSAKQTAEDIQALGRRAGAFQACVEDPDQDRALVEAVAGALGPVDLLVNNAGIASQGRSVERTDPEELDRVIRIHAHGPHHLCRLVLPAMKHAPRGDIVMISSVATRLMGPRSAPYNMGKAAMEALAFGLAKEVRKHGIRVNVVAPGLVETEMGRRLVKATSGVDDLRRMESMLPFGRVCQPEDVAAAVRFLVSEGGSYITGEKIDVTGGGP